MMLRWLLLLLASSHVQVRKEVEVMTAVSIVFMRKTEDPPNLLTSHWLEWMTWPPLIASKLEKGERRIVQIDWPCCLRFNLSLGSANKPEDRAASSKQFMMSLSYALTS